MGITEYPSALHTAVGRTDKRGQVTPNGFEMVMFTARSQKSPPAFETLCDVGQFTVTSGYAKVNVVDVPKRLGLTVFAGYDPLTVTVPLLFDNFGNPDHSADGTVERAINLLEWMAGRGESGVAREAPAMLSPNNTHPPLIEITSSNTQGKTGLIPNAYRGIEWLITGLAWGDSIRDESGNRQRQRVTVTALQQNDPGIEPAGKKPEGGQWTVYKITGYKDNTCIELAQNVVKSHKPAKVAKEILENGKNKSLKLRHIRDIIDKDKIKKGKRIWIPINRTRTP